MEWIPRLASPSMIRRISVDFPRPLSPITIADGAEMIRRSNLGEMTGTPQNISVAEGDELLGVLTGSKENSNALASDVGSQLGISADSIKTLLPMIAPMIAGMLNNQLKASNLQDSADSGSMMSMLTQFLDQNKDGSIVDDIFRIAGNFLGKK